MERYPADWDRHGRQAGVIRNRQMITEGNPNLVVAFHADIERSKGTKDMVTASTYNRIPTILITGAGTEGQAQLLQNTKHATPHPQTEGSPTPLNR